MAKGELRDPDAHANRAISNRGARRINRTRTQQIVKKEIERGQIHTTHLNLMRNHEDRAYTTHQGNM